MCISLSGWSAWPSLLRPACATSVAHKSQAGLGAADEEKEEGEDDRQNSKLWFLTRGQENSEGQRSLRLPKLQRGKATTDRGRASRKYWKCLVLRLSAASHRYRLDNLDLTARGGPGGGRVRDGLGPTWRWGPALASGSCGPSARIAARLRRPGFFPPDAAHGETSSGHLGMEETQPEGAGLAMLTLSFFGSALKRVERREVSATVGRPAGGGSV